MVLKRFLLFALLLDRAVSSANLPPGVPLLFCKGASIKSSHEVRCLSGAKGNAASKMSHQGAAEVLSWKLTKTRATLCSHAQLQPR